MKTIVQVYNQMRLIQKIVGWSLLFIITFVLNFSMPIVFAGLAGLAVSLAAFAATEFLWIKPYMRRAELIATLDAAAEKVRLERETKRGSDLGDS